MKQETILIVDDEKDIRDFLEFFLSQRGYRVLTAQDGAEGLLRAGEEHPDLILLDIMMPVLGGYEVMTQLIERKIPTRVIVLSAHASIENIIRFIKSGACDFLPKPCDPRTVQDGVKRALILESTLNLRVVDLAPSVEHLMDRVRTLEAECKTVQYRERAIGVGTKLFFLVASAVVTVAFQSRGLVTESHSALVLLVILFTLLLLPMDRVSELYAKLKNSEAKLKIGTK